MSILLDALKKSEAQRRLGETPTLQTNVSMDEGHNDVRQHWIPLALILLSAGIMTWTGIAQFDQDESLPASAELDGESSGVVVSQSGAEAIPAPGGAEQPTATSARTRGQSLPRNAATTPVKEYVVDDPPPDAGVPLPASRTGEDSETGSPQFADAQDASGAGARGLEAGTEPSRRVAHVEVDARPSAEVTVAGSPEGNAAAEPASARQEMAGQDGYAPQTISYWQMPQSLREEMGEFRISVLVYAENPADRFLLVNGSRLREQEETEGGVRLESIERDRAVFSYRSYRFHLQN